jgi:predicted lysophospholipase L1 biosynthesis ABC-type transport system permease subunit
VTNEKGEVEHWVAETTNPAMLNRVGWSRDALKPGDQVTLWVNPNKVGAKVTFLQKVTFSDGKELSTAKAF